MQGMLTTPIVPECRESFAAQQMSRHEVELARRDGRALERSGNIICGKQIRRNATDSPEIHRAFGKNERKKMF